MLGHTAQLTVVQVLLKTNVGSKREMSVHCNYMSCNVMQTLLNVCWESCVYSH